MKIESSAVVMNSNRHYESAEFTKINSQENKWQNTRPQEKLEKEDALSKFANDTKKLLEDQQAQAETKPQTTNQPPVPGQSQSIGSAFQLPDFREGQLNIIKQMLDLLFNGKHSGCLSNLDISAKTQKSMQGISIFSGNNASPMIASGSWVKNVNATHFFSEQESTSFSSTGIAKTEDGRELAFNVDLQMSRSFMEYTEVNWSEEVVMTDPLVINLNNNPTSLSDQKFFFDMDSDGKDEEISHLNNGSGYLALDQNNDGKINNGSELFGAKSGNGFADLAAYDSDKNGWIDENDDVYNKLKIWVKDENNEDKLLNLKAADVGAIYLGNTSTDFTLKSAESGQINGQIRRTGMYLKESTGMAKTIQQVDLSI